MKPQVWINGVNEDPPVPERVGPVCRPYSFNKPGVGAGLWTSTKGEEGWLEWLATEGYLDKAPGEHFGIASIWELEVRDSARILEIRGMDDLYAAIDRFPDTEPPYPEAEMGYNLDWCAIGEQYEGVHLTARGQWATRMPLRVRDGSPISLAGTMPPDLYGWDCESTFWFRWAFEGVKKLDVAAVKQALLSRDSGED